MIRLGPFEVTDVIGRGGYGEVWQGVHGASGMPVAVKVITAVAMRQPRARHALSCEVRAVARLRHPSVVQVFELGEVSRDAERASHGHLVSASPYLVMERVSGGTLAIRPPESWPALKRVLLDTLAALAHAHARGLVHRDLKPGNVLLSGPGDHRSGLRLTDWGIAHVIGSEEEQREDGRAVGTIRYMAPEQIRGRARDQGPWTDLYGLGCLAWRLVSGSVPFEATSPTGIAHRQLHVEPPPLQPRMPLPAEFESWLLRLLRKNPSERYPHAAAAARALRDLPDDPRGPAPSPAPRPELPDDWHPDPEASPAAELPGVGLGLFGVRRIPVFGREEERDLLWAELRRVAVERRPAAVVLNGPAGIGKSRVAEWLCQRAHESGVGDALKSSHDGPSSPLGTLGPMLCARLRSRGLERADVLERVRERLARQGTDDPWEVAALTELIEPASPDEVRAGAPTVRFASELERHDLVRRQLIREAGERPLVVWFDGVQPDDDDTLTFVRRTLDAQAPCPLLLVLTTRAEAPALAPLLDAPACRWMELGPLTGAPLRRLVGELLGLESDLARTVEERSGGVPLFAVQVVGDMVQRAVLEPSPAGFRLAPGAELRLPSSLHVLLQERVDEVLARWPADCRQTLEIGAALGASADAREWERACRRSSLSLPAGLLEDLALRGLIEFDEGGYTFSEPTLVESLCRSAVEAGRAPDQHRQAARALEELYTEGTPGLAERVAHHLVAAGDAEDALPALLEAAEERRARSAPAAATRLLDRREGSLAGLGIGRKDRRWAENDILRARVAGHATDFEQVRALAGRALTEAQAQGWTDLMPEAARTLAFALWQLGERELSESLYADALPQFSEQGHAEGVGRCRIGQGIAAAHRGATEEAEALMTAAVEAFDEAADARGLADAYGWLGILANRAGDHARAIRWYAHALSSAERAGHRLGVAMLRNSIAVVDRIEGRAAEAEAGFRASLALAEAIQSGEAVWPRINLAMLVLGTSMFNEARELFEQCLDDLSGRGRAQLVGLVRVGLAVCAASAADWDGFDAELDAATPLLRGQALLVAEDLGEAVRIAEVVLSGQPARLAALRELSAP